MMNKKILLVILFFGVFVFLSSFVLAQQAPYISSSGQVRPTYQTTYYSGSQMNTYWPVLGDRETCEAREDIILQVSPGGCQPGVVRSDLLTEQNVPVFCQVEALEINPLIDISRIRNIRVTGQYPKEVAGVSFHPNMGALSLSNSRTLLNNPVANNIGYLVVVLKKHTGAEDEIPEFVSFNLSARLEYDSNNAYGLGRSEFLLNPVSDSDWDLESDKNTFWNGRYSIRLNDVDANNARVSIYQGDREVGSRSVSLGEVSDPFYVPGMYCQAGLQVSYQGYQSYESKARLRISSLEGDEEIDIYEGSRFLDNQCVVNSISERDGKSSVRLSCLGNGSIILNVREREDIIGIGTEVSFEDAGDTKTGQVVKIDGGFYTVRVDKSNFDKTFGDLTFVSSYSQVFDEPLGKINIENVDYDLDELFDEAIESYGIVSEEYPSEINSKGEMYGVLALVDAIRVAENAGQSSKVVALIDILLERYPNLEDKEIYVNLRERNVLYDYSEAVSSVELRGDRYTFALVGKVDVNGKVSSVDISIGNEETTLEERVGGNSWSKDSSSSGSVARVQLVRVLDETRAEFLVNCVGENGRLGSSKSFAIDLGGSEEVCDGGYINLKDVNLEKVAKIVLSPYSRGAGSESPIRVDIGIEQRAIELTPERSAQRIENLNETIEKLSKINEKLGDTVSTLKAACFATSAALTVKNFFSGISGEALARQEVMSNTDGITGWNQICESAVSNGYVDRNRNGKADQGETGVSYSSIFDCLSDETNKNQIENEISQRVEATNVVNGLIQSAEGGNTEGSALLGGEVVNTEDAKYQLWLQNKDKTENGVKLIDTNLFDDPRERDNNWYTYNDLIEHIRLNKLKSQNYGGIDSSLTIANKEWGQLSTSYTESLNQLQSTSSLLSSDAISLIGGEQKVLEARFVSDVNNIGLNSDGKTKLSGEFNSISNGGDNTPAAVYVKVPDSSNGVVSYKEYLVFGNVVGGTLSPSGAYEVNSDDGSIGEKRSSSEVFSGVSGNVVIKDSSSGIFSKGTIVESDRRVRYYSIGPDKDKPAIVPFDIVNGWYAKVPPSSLSLSGGKTAYQANGLPNLFYIVNVGSDGRIGTVDDYTALGVNYGSDLSDVQIQGVSNTRRLIEDARNSILEASRQYGRNSVTINGQQMLVEKTAAVAGSQCTDFMSAEDCNLLFNVCDPVICPSTRCNLGGKYQVSDVIQSGIIGSTLLCLPNANEGIYVPVCLSGIHAGLEGYLSILESNVQCLEENIETGRYTGVCDQITAVYTCEFFWRQVAPFTRELIPSLVESLYTGNQGARGGGEYRTVQGAWDAASASMDFMMNEYAVNAFEAFQVRTIDEAGTEFCRAFISSKAPTQFEGLVEPESPPQFHAWFDSIEYSDVTVPSTNQYKVFYHIFAGNDKGSNFRVYLKRNVAQDVVSVPSTIIVAQGFLPLGETATESKDFTAPEGYGELCVLIDNEESCGFNQVSTSFAINYLSDKLVSEELTNSNIKTEQECYSGDLNLGSLAGSSLGAGIEGVVIPDAQSYGISRICSTDNPGGLANPSRYVDVGYCSDSNVRCWLDKESVENAISVSNLGQRNDTLRELEEIASSSITGLNGEVSSSGIVSEIEDVRSNSEKIDNLESLNQKNIALNNLIYQLESLADKTYDNSVRANLLYERAVLKGKLFEVIFNHESIRSKIEGSRTASVNTQPSSNTESSGSTVSVTEEKSESIGLENGFPQGLSSSGTTVRKLYYYPEEGDKIELGVYFDLNSGYIDNNDKIYFLKDSTFSDLGEGYNVGDINSKYDLVFYSSLSGGIEVIYILSRNDELNELISEENYEILKKFALSN